MMTTNFRARNLFLTASGVLLAVAVAHAQPGLNSYDGFSGPPRPDLDGATGGIGWTTPWQDAGTGIITSVGGAGLQFPGLVTSPGQAMTPSAGIDYSDYARGHAAIAGDVMYVSCLLRPEADYTNWFVLRFGAYPHHVDVGIPIGYTVYGLSIGDALFALSPIGAVPGQTVLLVLEVTHNPDSNSTQYRLYVNPQPGHPKPQFASASTGRAGLMPFGGGIELRGQGGYTLDEVRIGTTFEAVTPTGAPTCASDFDLNGVREVPDIFAFLSAWFAQSSSADFDSSGTIAVPDIFAFLSRWFAGC